MDDKINLILNPVKKVFRFYYDGFCDMSSWGRKVWIIILIKLFIIAQSAVRNLALYDKYPLLKRYLYHNPGQFFGGMP